MFEDYPDILTVAQVSKILGVCDATSYRLIHDGSLGSCRVGRKILIPKVCLIDFVNSARYTKTHL
ncbi:MAG: helix-turn-helix domain-containing protein [Oscillospiraceae bacterium]|jgi:excisionase family DNA binding protein|nr:helix-turn-helix domain-containing protein [Oscillospiraceae bacterium]